MIIVFFGGNWTSFGTKTDGFGSNLKQVTVKALSKKIQKQASQQNFGTSCFDRALGCIKFKLIRSPLFTALVLLMWKSVHVPLTQYIVQRCFLEESGLQSVFSSGNLF